MIPNTGNLHLLEHRYAASGVDQREVLRRRDDNGAGQRRALRHGQLNVAGARRHVHHQAIQFAPRHFAQQLRHRRHDHRAAPDDGRLLVDHQADRDHLDAKGDERNQKGLFDFGLLVEAEQARRRGAEHVGVEQADAPALLRHRDGEVGGDGRFADAALARGDRDDIAHAGHAFGDARTSGGPGGGLMGMAVRGLRAGPPLGGQRDDRRGYAGDPAKRAFRRRAHRLGPRRRRGFDDDRQIDLAVALGQPADRARSGQRRAAVRPVHRAKRLGDRVLVNQSSSPWMRRQDLTQTKLWIGRRLI